MKSIFRRLYGAFISLTQGLHTSWRRYRRLRKPYQVAIGALVIVLVVWGLTLVRGGGEVTETSEGRTVTLSTVATLARAEGSVDLYGTVRSITEAKILAQTGGVVRAVHTNLGARVSAGAVIAELENAAERAAVLSAEGSYEAAVAAQQSVSPTDARTAAINAYKSAYNTLNNVLETEVDQFFGSPTGYGPKLLILSPMYDYGELSSDRRDMSDRLEEYRRTLATAGSGDPATLLANANTVAQEMYDFVTKLGVAATDRVSGSSDTQLDALAAARTAINTLLSTLATAQETYRSASVSSTASTDASVKQALGGLRSAQAALEKTMVRAPIAGQLNFLSIRVGDYVTATQHVATVAQNGSLEVVAYVSEDNRDLLVAGGEVTVAQNYRGIITSIAPALDPTTKQIEVRIALTAAEGLVNGQSVAISLPNMAPTSAEAVEGPLMLPLTAVKLRSGDRVVFSVDGEGRLVAHPVEVGEVHGDRIEILTPLDRNLQIVTDARGLAEGEAVKVVSPDSPALVPQVL